MKPATLNPEVIKKIINKKEQARLKELELIEKMDHWFKNR